MYQALYRKWRPKVFADVVGQSHITETLMNEIMTGRHSHAYLFTGSRGTGKTTCAKIFAKAVNCQHPVNGDPCNQCDICRGIDDGSILDVVEIDAASNNSVDNIRDIRDEAKFTPVNGRYRVYIIDEVHMLSPSAFNALLKTLEEPPEHVKFVLATTEVQKLPATILSRCQRFDFKRIRPEDIAGRITYVAQQENLNLTAEAANLIARLADGALRDALSILDQCISHGRDIDEAVVNEVVGLAGKDHLFALADSILRHDSAAALNQINLLYSGSCEMDRLCNELINHFRNLMIAKAVKDPHGLIVCSDQELQEYRSMAAGCSMGQILQALDVLGETMNNLRKGLNRRVEVEMAMIRLCGDLGAAAPVATASVPHAVAPQATVARPNGAAPARTAPAARPEPVQHSVPPVAPAASASVAPQSAPTSAAPTVPESLPFDLDEPEEEQPDNTPLEGQTALYTEALPVPEEAPPEYAGPAAEYAPSVPEYAPPVPEEPPMQPIPDAPYISLQEELPDGPVPTDVWNALVREICAHDKPFIGCINSAKAYKRGEALLIDTDNFLVKNFLPKEDHRRIFMDATYTVMGQYLTPIISTPEEIASLNGTTATPATSAPATHVPVTPAPAAPAPATSVPVTSVPAAPVPESPVETAEHAAKEVPAEKATEPVETATETEPVAAAEKPTRQEEATPATQATQTDEPEDPLLPFIDKLTALGVDLTIEE